MKKMHKTRKKKITRVVFVRKQAFEKSAQISASTLLKARFFFQVVFLIEFTVQNYHARDELLAMFLRYNFTAIFKI